MPRIALAQAAQRDLDEIFDWLELQQPHLSDRFARTFDETCALYLRQPTMGALCEELEPGLRCFTVWRYLVFYRPIEDGLSIARIVHATRDYPALFR